MILVGWSSGGQGGDLDQVVGQDPLSGPGPGSFQRVQARAVPSVAAFEGADPAFAAGSPLHGSPERRPMLDGPAGGAVSALAGDDDVPHAAVGQLLVDTGLAIATVAVTVRGVRPVRSVIRSIAGASCGASGGLPSSTLWSSTIPSSLSTTCPL